MSWVSRVSRYPGRDLITLAAASLVSLGLMALPVDGLLKSLLLVPLVLFIPGYALAAAMFPAATLGRGERLVYAFLSASARRRWAGSPGNSPSGSGVSSGPGS